MEELKTRINNFGFTLIELLVVISIIGLLSTLSILGLKSTREKAGIGAAKSNVRTLVVAIELLRADTGRWPAHDDNTGGCPDISIIDPAATGINWSYEPDFAFNCELVSGPKSNWRKWGNILRPWYGLTGLDPRNASEYPNWNGPYLQNIGNPDQLNIYDPNDPDFIEPGIIDAWGVPFMFDPDYAPLPDPDPAVIMSLGPDKMTYTADDLYMILRKF